jgi:hypothetical protein
VDVPLPYAAGAAAFGGALPAGRGRAARRDVRRGGVPPVSAAYRYDYSNYLSQIAAYVSPDTKTLANLNAGFYLATTRCWTCAT